MCLSDLQYHQFVQKDFTKFKMPGLRILGAQNRNVRWAMVYVIYILVSIGLIVDTAVTLRYGNDFFTNPTGNPQAPPALGGTGANGTQADEKTTQFQIGRRNALITSGVVSSVGIAIVNWSPLDV